MTTSWVLRARLVAYIDPLVLPMLAELSDEYSARYGEGHGFVGLYRATGYTPQFDESLPPERIGKHAFTKELPVDL